MYRLTESLHFSYTAPAGLHFINTFSLSPEKLTNKLQTIQKEIRCLKSARFRTRVGVWWRVKIWKKEWLFWKSVLFAQHKWNGARSSAIYVVRSAWRFRVYTMDFIFFLELFQVLYGKFFFKVFFYFFLIF